MFVFVCFANAFSGSFNAQCIYVDAGIEDILMENKDLHTEK